MYVRNTTRATTVGTHIALADTSLSRLVGLLGKRRLEAGRGLLIRPSSGVHTFAMLFPIDVVALDRNLQVIRLWPGLSPWRITGIDWKITSILELPSGQIHACQIAVGDQLVCSST